MTLQPKKYMMIVTTDASLVKMFVRALESEKYIIAHCKDTSEALIKAVENKPDLVYLHKNAIDGIDALNKHPLVQANPVVFLSDRSDSEEKTQVFDAGCLDLLVEPLAPGELSSKTEYHIRSQQLRVQSAARNTTVADQKNTIARISNMCVDLKKRMDTYLEILPMGILLTTPEGKIIDANPELLNIVGLDSFEALSKTNIQSFYYDELDRGKFLEEMATGRVRNLEIRFRRFDGVPIWCALSSVREQSQQHGVYFISSVLDITEKKNSEVEKQNLLIQLAQSEKLASIGLLSAGVAHEINNPVGFVKSNINSLDTYISGLVKVINTANQVMSCLESEIVSKNLLKFKTAYESFAREIDLDYILDDIPLLMTDCKEGLDRIGQIVADLKDFAHPGHKDHEPVNLNICIESALSVLRSKLKDNAVIRKDYSDIPTIMGVPQQLNQVFLNILLNAAHAIHPKGRIWINTRQEGKNIIVEIKDNGCGIPEKLQSKIFDPFFTTKKIGEGTGLGMHISYNIIKNHKGNIYLESIPGDGTKFTIVFPVTESH